MANSNRTYDKKAAFNALTGAEARRVLVSQLYREGKTFHEMSAVVHCSISTIHEDLKMVRARWLESAMMDFGERKAEELAKIDQLEKVAWEAWYRSCSPSSQEKMKQEFGFRTPKVPKGSPPPQPKRVLTGDSIEKLKRDRDGDPRFLDRIAWCIETRCKLTGILKDDAKPQTVLALPDGFWEKLSKPVDEWEDAEITEHVQGRIGAGGPPAAPNSPQENSGE